MVVLLSTVISCSQAFDIINRLQRVIGLTEVQKSEISYQIKKSIPNCPVKVVQESKK